MKFEKETEEFLSNFYKLVTEYQKKTGITIRELRSIGIARWNDKKVWVENDFYKCEAFELTMKGEQPWQKNYKLNFRGASLFNESLLSNES